jgi:hypothetical protein
MGQYQVHSWSKGSDVKWRTSRSNLGRSVDRLVRKNSAIRSARWCSAAADETPLPRWQASGKLTDYDH